MMTIAQAVEAIRSGRQTPLDLVDQCLARIRKYDNQVRAWVLVDDENARDTARRLGEEAAQGKFRGPLHGIPIAIKDIFDVQGWPTLAGSRLREAEADKYVAQQDATVVKRLRDAGAILLGKTVTTEFASFDPSPTRNPWNLLRTPGGSSSGSAAATALGMCLGAMASQTGGSITRPASYCGVAGCKPTFGRVSCQGVLSLAFSMDHPGPIARSVSDLALLLQVIAGPDDADPLSAAIPVADYVEAVTKAGEPPPFGLLDGYFLHEADAAVRQVVTAAVDKLRQAGAKVVPVADPIDFAVVNRLHRRIMAVEAAEYHRATFPSRRSEYGPCITALLDEALALPIVDYAEAKRHQAASPARMRPAFTQVEVLLTPATPIAAPGLETTGDPKFNSPWSYCGLPTASIPCGLTSDGLPVALQLVGKPFEEGALLAAAAWCEKILGFTGEPGLLKGS